MFEVILYVLLVILACGVMVLVRLCLKYSDKGLCCCQACRTRHVEEYEVASIESTSTRKTHTSLYMKFVSRYFKQRKKHRRLYRSGINLKDKSCAICLDEYNGNPQEIFMAYIKKCDHFFHFDCLWKWLETKGNCPICREDVKLSERDIRGVSLQYIIDKLEREGGSDKLEANPRAVVSSNLEIASSDKKLTTHPAVQTSMPDVPSQIRSSHPQSRPSHVRRSQLRHPSYWNHRHILPLFYSDDIYRSTDSSQGIDRNVFYWARR